MTKVKFFNDFQGVETNNVFYPAGVHDVPDHVASRVVRDGRAEYAEGKGVAAHNNTPQIEEVSPAAEVEQAPEEPVMTSRKFKRGK